MATLNETHAPELRSWVDSANRADTDFPVQNLPFGRFRRVGAGEDFRIGVAIGDQILDLRAAGLIEHDDMNVLMSEAPARRQALRLRVSRGLRAGSEGRAAWQAALVPQADAEYAVPCRIGDYTDFYTGIYHATSVGRLFRPEQPLMPNYKWVPIGYHGRVSSIGVSGQRFQRPLGQSRAAEASAPVLGPSRRLDYELELGFFVGGANRQGEPIGMEAAEDHLFGVCLLNDWSARDLQAWEYQPLGPFLSKNFATTLSPWIVTMEALAPFRAPFARPADDPAPLAYLDSDRNRSAGALDIHLEVWLHSAKMRDAGQGPCRLSCGNAAQAAYWTPAQLIAHHTINGCNLQSGDLLGSGTLSGPEADQAGSLLELTAGGKTPLQLSNGETRTFLEDGDTVILRGFCEREGAIRIGLGEARGTVVAR